LGLNQWEGRGIDSQKEKKKKRHKGRKRGRKDEEGFGNVCAETALSAFSWAYNRGGRVEILEKGVATVEHARTCVEKQKTNKV